MGNRHGEKLLAERNYGRPIICDDSRYKGIWLNVAQSSQSLEIIPNNRCTSLYFNTVRVSALNQ